MTKSQDIPGLDPWGSVRDDPLLPNNVLRDNQARAYAADGASGTMTMDSSVALAMIAEITRSRTAPKSEGAVTGEPVAWEVTDEDANPDHSISRKASVAEIWRKAGFNVRPLYTAPSNPLPAAREEVGVSGAANVRNVAANVRNEMARILTAIKMPTNNADKEDIISYATEIVGLRVALRRAPATPSQEAILRVARLILSVSSISYDEANNERRAMARAAAEKVIAALASPPGQESVDNHKLDNELRTIKPASNGSETVISDVAMEAALLAFDGISESMPPAKARRRRHVEAAIVAYLKAMDSERP